MQRCLMMRHPSSLYFTNLQALLKEKSRESLGFFTEDDQKLILDKRLGTSKQMRQLTGLHCWSLTEVSQSHTSFDVE